jgi:3-deoxy-D-manno-octulosonic-acid transferase
VGKTLYSIFVRLYPFAIRLVSPFNEKARLWEKGRKDIFLRLQQALAASGKLIWMHCASLGEFEQGRPVLEKLTAVDSDIKVLLTFFSPSGYEVRKNYKGADYVFYLPIDSADNARRFFDIVKPVLILFVKYEFWHYYLTEAKKRNIPLFLISAIFRKNQPFFSTYGKFHRHMLACFTHFFVQNEESVALLQSIGIVKNVSLSGDTRFDRVIEIAENFEPISVIEAFCAGSDVIVAGSTWTEDDKELAHYANSKSNVKFIIAPHNIIKDRLEECRRLYRHSVLFSSLTLAKPATDVNTVVIDNIGMLGRLYKYATVAYIGGGFGEDGVHNVLEAAVYGRPVVFGPEYDKFLEAIELIDADGATSVDNALELENTFDRLLKKDEGYQEKCNSSLNYVYSKRGATDKIIGFIYENRLLTK